MADWWVALASVRVAPIQIMTLGHPASSRSPEMDYVLVTETMPGDPTCFSERVMLLRGDLAMVTRGDAEFPAPEIRESPEVLRIAVPSMACKVNAPFLQACANIACAASRRLEFHFFPSLVGLTLRHFVAEVRRWLPEAVVYPRSDYNTYLRNLARCDLHLSTFPFGGTNSNIDSMRLGIPMVTLQGVEVHGQTDSGMMRSVGLPETLIAHDPSEFERTALRVIASDRERTRLARFLADRDVERVFMDREDNPYSRDFAEAVWAIYRFHEAFVADGRQYWSADERTAFVAAQAAARPVPAAPFRMPRRGRQ